MKQIILTKGQRFGRLTVIKEKPQQGYKRFILCKCDCGNKKTVGLYDLTGGRTKSCGCLQTENRIKHGKWHDPLYLVWYGMIDRCYNKEHSSYKHYGARGVRVCKAWYRDINKFIEWAKANGYKKGLQLDRRDNDLGYRPSNCRFVTSKVNMRNRRCTIRVIVQGKQMTFAEAHELYGKVKYTTALMRFTQYGWSAKKSLTQPLMSRR